jgi:phosphate-selective porin OprO/OprP
MQTQFLQADEQERNPAEGSIESEVSPTNNPTLEEQIAELRARLDSVLAAQNAMSSPDSGSPSAGQENVFDNAASGRGTVTGPPTGGEPSTVQGSVFAADAAGGPSWANDGLTFASPNGEFKTHIGGLAQLDVIGFGDLNNITSIPGGAGNQESVEFRRLRVRFDGTMYKHIDWVFELDFALALQNLDQQSPAAPVTGLRSFPAGVGVQGGNTINVIQPTTIFMTFKDIWLLGNVRVGTQQSWFSLEHIESARFLDFMERSPLMDAFAGANNNGYAPGVSAFNNTEDMRAGAQIGVYKNNVYDSGFTYNIGDAWTYGGRLIWSPYYDEESKGRYMVHTGFGTEYRTFNDNVSATTGFDNVRLRSRGDLRNAAATLDPNYADTGNFYATDQVLINPELAVVWGPWLLQGEYTASWMNGARPAKNINTSLGTAFFEGGYLEALYFLTGENRVYNRQLGVFNRVVPKENWSPSKGTWGAWQVGVRYDTLNLNSGAYVNGGNASDLTIGLNWFLNGNTRFQFNYVFTWVNNAPATTFPGTLGALNGARFVGDGTVQSFGARLDYNF